jgi:hypothetical protein
MPRAGRGSRTAARFTTRELLQIERSALERALASRNVDVPRPDGTISRVESWIRFAT